MAFTTIRVMNEIVASSPIITQMDRSGFQNALLNNPGGLIIKFGAEWCGPCKTIDPLVYSFMNQLPVNVQGAIIDIDDNFDIYAFLKSKRQVNGVPAILFYKKGNLTWVPDGSVIGADESKVRLFFQQCFTSVS